MPVIPDVVTTTTGGVDAVVAGDGTLAYVSGEAAPEAQRTLVWVDRQGRETPIAAPPRAYAYPRISPDGTRVAFDVRDQDPQAITPDGRFVLFRENDLSTRRSDIMMVPLPSTLPQESTASASDSRAPTIRGVQPLIATMAQERNPEFSPDGRWLAYQSDESGQFEVYVRPFPNASSGRWQISNEGGSVPLWSRDARELFYLSSDEAMRGVRVRPGLAWANSPPTTVLRSQYFDATAGGRSSTLREMAGS